MKLDHEAKKTLLQKTKDDGEEIINSKSKKMKSTIYIVIKTIICKNIADNKLALHSSGSVYRKQYLIKYG